MKMFKLPKVPAIVAILLLAVVFEIQAQIKFSDKSSVEIFRVNNDSTIITFAGEKYIKQVNSKIKQTETITGRLSSVRLMPNGWQPTALLYVDTISKEVKDSIKVYTVKWCLYEQIPIPCPDAGKKDKFGRVSQYGCLVYHSRMQITCDSLEFFNQNNAYKFYSDAIKESNPNSFSNIGIKDVKIDSVWINNR